MNNFDDRMSYNAYLYEKGRWVWILDANIQEEISLCTFGAFGGRFNPWGKFVGTIACWTQDVWF